MNAATLYAVPQREPVPAAAHAAPTVYGSIIVGGASTDDTASTIYAPGGAIFAEGSFEQARVAPAPARPLAHPLTSETYFAVLR